MNAYDKSKLDKLGDAWKELCAAESMLEHQFYCPPQIVTKYFSEHYLLHWRGDYLTQQILASKPRYAAETITHNEVSYVIRYLENSAWNLVMNPMEQYKLSFRRMKEDRYGVVLIKQCIPAARNQLTQIPN